MPIGNPAFLSQMRGFILDMDGTFYLGDHLLPGSLEFIGLLRRRGIPFLFLTNNSSRQRTQYADRLRGMGLVDLADEQVFTSGEAAAIYLAERMPAARLFVVGTSALEAEFSGRGFELVAENPDVVMLGFDTTLTYNKLWKLCDLVRSGKPYFATHPDINCPVENGFMPDIGAVMALVAASTGRQPDVIIGKPYPFIVEAVVKKTGLPVESLAMVGDRLYTDIALGQAGLSTILVLSGETQLADLPGSPFKPDLVVANLAELERLLFHLGAG